MDIDIDFQDRNYALTFLDHRIAANRNNDPHASGVYFHEIPHNPKTKVATIDFKEAESRGYFKIDFLNVNVYNGVKSEDHLLRLMQTEPLWELLEVEEFTNLLFQINGHHQLLKKMKPKSAEQLAAVVAMIRPAKRYLIGESWDRIMEEIWTKSNIDDGYAFKKAHAFSYAMAIIVQMNLLCEPI